MSYSHSFHLFFKDFHSVESINWEAIIVDECQNSRVSKNLEHLKNLASDIRMLLLSAPLKVSDKILLQSELFLLHRYVLLIFGFAG